MLFGKGLIDSSNDSNGLQLIKFKGFADEVSDEVERVQNFGMTSRPKANDPCIIASIGGNRDHSVCISIDSKDHRPKDLVEGETAYYNAFNCLIKLDSSGNINITPGAGNLVINGNSQITGNITMTGNLNITGALSVSGALTAGSIATSGGANLDTLKSDFDSHVTTYNTHVHSGVTTGAGISGGPQAPP